MNEQKNCEDIESNEKWDFKLGWNAAPVPLVAFLFVLLVGLALGAALTSSRVAMYVCSSLAWLITYDLLVRIFFSHGGVWYRRRGWGINGDEGPRTLNIVSMIHQFLILGVLFAACVLTRTGDLDQFWYGESRETMLPQQFYLALIFYEVKDFYPGRGINLVFLVHHAATIFGSYISLTTPYALGIVTAVGYSAELGSGFYGLHCVCQKNLTVFVLYQIMMTVSNTFCAWGASQYYKVEGVESWRRIVYLVITCLLIPLRTAGQVLEYRAFVKHKGKEGGGADIENPAHSSRPNSATSETELA